VPIRRGRDFTEHDDAHAPGVVIINEAMAQKYWPVGDPLQDRLFIGRGMRDAYDQDPVRQIVGIVGNVRDTGLRQVARPAMYVPMAQIPDAVTVPNVQLLPLVWIVRTADDPHHLGARIKGALESASGLPVARVRAMSDVVAESTARARFDMWLMTIFGACAVVLAAVGIYGLIAYWVQQRAREIGIRLAMGASASTVATMVVRQGMRLAMAGVAVGLVGAFNLAWLIANLLFGVRSRDPFVFISVPALLTVVAFLAVWMPARRASRLDPMVTLRSE
jgi:predicted lysophospholipase L1 biosynthesis ABC-type transport system permease subunit